ncbi:MAG: BatA and WFA domain-containing protein [Clostridia bacterium]|nr:BatA and WFA domain-containing protein [Clostridia bacterium]
MTFLYPMGLLGLIGVPIIILIYILKNKYNEQTVPSTYLWTLSEKFFKRRNPLSGLTGIISLILQLLTVVIVSLAIARPIFTLPDSAGEYCFVLDCSGSMNTESDGSSRFERAKRDIIGEIDGASAGSTYTLIAVSDETAVIYERLTDKKLARQMLEEVPCSDGGTSYSEALVTAQKYFDKNRSFIVTLYTDKSVDVHENAEVVNVAFDKEFNYSLSDVSGTFMGGELSVGATVLSYSFDTTLELALYLDGKDTPVKRTEVAVKAGEPMSVSMSCKTDSYESFRVAIENEDSLAADNEFISYNLKNESAYRILIVSETPFFLQAALDVLTDTVIDTARPDAYREGDYGLYIFHSFTPAELPDAAVWLINSSMNVENSGFGARGIVELDAPAELEKSDSTSTVAQKLLTGVYGKDILISEYVKYSSMYTRFTTLFSYDSHPLIFAGVNGFGNREVVIGFDLHKADFSLSTDFVALLGNLLEYSCPDVIERSEYTCGEDVAINITANIRNVKVTTPLGEEIYIDTSSGVATFRLGHVGTYMVSLLASDVEKNYKIYSGAPAEEGNPVQSGEAFSLSGVQEYERTDGEFDPLMIFFVCLAVILIADWMVYCYEKYQLR